MDYKIAILITTFLRDNLLYKTIQTIVDYYPKDCIILIADQGYADSEKEVTIDYFKSQIPLEYYQIAFDSGLSYARNFLVNIAYEKNIPYILMGADSIQFTQPYDFKSIINFLERDSKRGLVGGELLLSKCSWEFYLKLSNRGIHLIPSKDYITENNITYKKCDIVRNIFLAKTSTLLNIYDEEMKLGEHELMFLEYKKRGCEVYWTDYLIFKRIQINCSEEYNSYRKRFEDYKKLLKQKLNIKNWVIYEK